MGRSARILLLAVLLTSGAGAVTATSAPASPLAATPCAAATWSHHVALVVEHGNGSSLRYCIGFNGASISGIDILNAARSDGLEYATVSYGGTGDAVCQIDHEPVTYPSSCWTASSPYWAFFVARGGGAWSASPRGVDSEYFADGDAAGFRYDSQSGAAAAPVSATGTCTLTSAPPTPAPTATPRLAPTGTATHPARPSAPAASSAPAAGVAAATFTPAAASTNGASAAPAQSTPGVAAFAGSLRSQSPGPGVDVAGALGGVLLVVALAGLLAVQLRRRRRT